MELEIPIIGNSHSDLEQFDFSFKDIYIVNITSDKFREYLTLLELNPEYDEMNYEYMLGLIKEMHFDQEKFYAVIKWDYNNNYSQSDITNVYKLLLIIFPSDLQVLHKLSYFRSDKGLFNPNGVYSWDSKTTGEYAENWLFAGDNWLQETNKYIKLIFDRLNQDNYVGLAISHYLSSFSASHYHYQYLALCMVLEATTSGTSELTYRLKRNICILLGENVHESKIVFSNINKIYSLRSKIIHGEMYDPEKVIKYLPFLLALASRTIIEVLLHNYQTNSELNEKITELGFGARTSISDNYKKYTLNIFTDTKSTLPIRE